MVNLKTTSTNYQKIAIIIPTVFGGKKLLECIKSITKLNYPQNKIQIVLIDNNTPDKSYILLKKQFPKIITISNKINIGFPEAVNQGIKTVISDYYFITNDDIIFEKESLKILINLAQNNPNIGICGGKQLSPKTKRFLAGGHNFSFYSGLQKNVKTAGVPIKCDQIDGCTMLIKKAVIKEIGLFDKGFSPVYSEDLDYCLRAKKSGFDIIYHPKAIFYHHYSYSTSKSSLFNLYYLGFRNKIRFFIKHASFFQFLSFIIIHYFFILPTRLLIRKEPILLPEIKAIAWNLQNLQSTLKTRKYAYKKTEFSSNQPMTSEFITFKIKNENFLQILLLVAGLGTIMRIAFAFFLPLESDEVYQLLVSKAAILPMLEATINVHAPVWSLILHFLPLSTNNYILFRLVTVFLGFISIITIGFVGKILFNSKTAIVTAAVFALSPTQIYYSTNLRMYSLAILVSILIFLLFIKFLKSNQNIYKFFLLSALIIANYTYYLFPLIPSSLFIYLLLNKKNLAKKFKTFTLIFALSLVATLPLLIAFLHAEPLPSVILPQLSFEKILLIPIHYTFAQDLALMMENDILKVSFVKLILLGFSLINITFLLHFLTTKTNKEGKLLTLMLFLPMIFVIIFSFLVFSVLGLRSILIFSIPFYILLGRAVVNKGKILFIYLLFSTVAVFLTLIFFIQKPPNSLDTYLSKIKDYQEPILHTEITTFLYYSYKYPQLHNKAAIDSLYTPAKTKTVFGYVPVNPNDLKDKSFWLIEVLLSPLHRDKVANFKTYILKSHYKSSEEIFGNVAIYKYEAL